MAQAGTGAARFSKRRTQAEIDAYLTAVLIDGIDQAEAMRRAHTGTLKAGVAPFGKYNGQSRLVFGYDIVARYGQEFVERNPQAEDADTLALMREAHQANKRALRGLDKDVDPGERTRLMKAVADSRKALASVEPRETQREKAKPSAREAENHGQEPNDTLATLVGLANTRETHNGTANTRAEAQDGAAGPVPSLAS